jgi:hypothetical protein
VISLKSKKPDSLSKEFHPVDARKDAGDFVWKTYSAKTIDRLKDFNYTTDPELGIYGGWKTPKY